MARQRPEVARGHLAERQVDGVLTEWYANGQKKTEWAFKDGKAEGVWTYWDDKGNVTKTETYKNGKLVK